MKFDLDLRCYRCDCLAIEDWFEGEYSAEGYLCKGCIRVENERIVKAFEPSTEHRMEK